MLEWLFAGGLIFVGSLIQSAFGFGMAVIAAPLLVMFYPAALPGPLIAMALVQCLLVAMRHRREIQFRPLASAMLGRIPGSLLGAWLLSVLSVEVLSIFVGSAVVMAVAVSMSSITVHPNTRTMFWAGAISGVFGTSTTVGGPPMALLLQHQEAAHLRGNLAAFFIYGCLVSLLMLALIGRYGVAELELTLSLLPWAITGFLVCQALPLHRYEHRMRPIILVLCAVSGITAIVTAVLRIAAW